MNHESKGCLCGCTCRRLGQIKSHVCNAYTPLCLHGGIIPPWPGTVCERTEKYLNE
jgi:hypothetical protein